jgi:hypothetical protein
MVDVPPSLNQNPAGQGQDEEKVRFGAYKEVDEPARKQKDNTLKENHEKVGVTLYTAVQQIYVS